MYLQIVCKTLLGEWNIFKSKKRQNVPTFYQSAQKYSNDRKLFVAIYIIFSFMLNKSQLSLFIRVVQYFLVLWHVWQMLIPSGLTSNSSIFKTYLIFYGLYPCFCYLRCYINKLLKINMYLRYIRKVY